MKFSQFQFRSEEFDSELAGIMRERLQENEDGVTLIASENHPHPDDVASFMDAVDATFEGGYFEGYPSDKALGWDVIIKGRRLLINWNR